MPINAVSITTITDDSNLADRTTNDNQLTFSGTFSGINNSPNSHILIQYSTDGGSNWTDYITGPTVSVNTGTFSNLTGTALPDGSAYTFRALAIRDNNGNQLAASTPTAAWTIDTVAPTFGAITVAGDDHITTVGEEGTLHVTGSSTGAVGRTVTVTLMDDSNAVLHTGTGTIDGSGNYDVTFTGFTFAAGNYKVQVSTTDLAGNPGVSVVETFDSTVCFLAGTMIRTPDGEKAIEALLVGDLVVTADGSSKPVKFIGKQTVSLIFADALRSQPILIKAGALDENVPSRDLYTSPGHAMILDGNMVIAGALVNGKSIVRWENSPKVFAYYHIELDDHAVIFANDAPTETYCDNIPRETFDNGREYMRLYPDAKPIQQMDMPHVKSQRQMPAETRKRLAARAAALASELSKVA